MLHKKFNQNLSENHHQLLHIQISLGSKFQLQQTTLSF